MRLNHKLEFLQSQLEEMETEKEEIKKAKSVLEVEVLEIRGELQKTSRDNEILKEERNAAEERALARAPKQQ